MGLSRTTTWLLLGSLVLSGPGCGKVLHNLQMHRLHHLNRVPDRMSDSGYNFSIPNPPLPAFEGNSQTQTGGDQTANREPRPDTE